MVTLCLFVFDERQWIWWRTYPTSIVNAKRHLAICKNILAPLANKSRIATVADTNILKMSRKSLCLRHDCDDVCCSKLVLRIASGIRRVARGSPGATRETHKNVLLIRWKVVMFLSRIFRVGIFSLTRRLVGSFAVRRSCGRTPDVRKLRRRPLTFECPFPVPLRKRATLTTRFMRVPAYVTVTQ